jgi:hypothetical protein
MEIDFHKIVSHPMAAGALGALLGLKFLPGVGAVEKVTNATAGCAFAGYVAPAVCELFGLSSAAMQSAMSFAIGLFGLGIARAVFEAARAVDWAKLATGWLKRPGS